MSLTTRERPRELKHAAAAQANTPAEITPHHSPAAPLIIIESRKSWAALNLRELWNYRELLYFLMWRDIKVRYKQTLLGVAWVVIQPLATMLIFTIFFGRLAGLGAHTGGIPYPIFAFAGLVLWTFFAAAVSSAGNSLVSNAHPLTKVYFPRLIVPIAAAGALLVDFAIGLLLLVGMMFYYGAVPTAGILTFPLFVALTIVLAVSVGTLVSALSVKYRDIRYALPFLMQMWMFASPVIYPTTLVPESWRWVLALNPMAGIIEGFRTALFGGREFDWRMLGASAAVTLALFVVASYNFRRMEKEFADIV